LAEWKARKMGITLERQKKRENRVGSCFKDEAGLKLKACRCSRVEVGEFIEDKPDVNCFILYSIPSGKSKY